MKLRTTDWRTWLAAARQTTIALALAMIVLMWVAVEFDLQRGGRGAASILTIFMLAGIAIGIRHRVRLEQTRSELQASEARERQKTRELELTLDNMSQGIMMIDADDMVAVVNRQAVDLLDLPDTVYFRPRFSDLLAHHVAGDEGRAGGETVDQDLWKTIKAGAFGGSGTYERTRPNGVTLEIRTALLPGGGIVRTFTDVSERKRGADKIAHMAHHDGLTGLANRILLQSDMEGALRRQRRQGPGFALLLIDLDRFKHVNDTLGHAAGDVLLCNVAQRLIGCVREVDTVARLGGDEFAILQAATEGRESVEALARRVVAVIGAPYMLDDQPAVVGASVGIAQSVDSPAIEQLFHNADLALYRAKSEGRNGFRLFEPHMDEAAQARRKVEEELRQARGRGEFEVYYQPMFDFATRKVTSVEALLRWNHPARGQIAPAEFMPMAEDIGIVGAIDAWVLATACREAARWPGDVAVAINLSPSQFKQRTLLDLVRRTLADAKLPAQMLELEISERTQLLEEDGSLGLLRDLHGLGVRIALDDFGIAHSSLGNLRAFSFEKIKIDQSFIAEMEISQECAAIVAAIAGLGRSLGAETTAGGIETPLQAELARAAGCTQAQGCLYSRPLTAGAIMELLTAAAPGELAVA